MDLKTFGRKVKDYAKKYRFVLLVLVVGLIFMLIPSKKEDEEQIEPSETVQTLLQPSLDELLADILSKIEGAGKVQVLLTKAKGEETVYQTDTSGTQISTVIISNQERAEEGLIMQVNPPVYLGAIVVCQGADSPSVRLAVVEAVSNVTGLGSDRISVLKMK